MYRIWEGGCQRKGAGGDLVREEPVLTGQMRQLVFAMDEALSQEASSGMRLPAAVRRRDAGVMKLVLGKQNPERRGGTLVKLTDLPSPLQSCSSCGCTKW